MLPKWLAEEDVRKPVGLSKMPVNETADEIAKAGKTTSAENEVV